MERGKRGKEIKNGEKKRKKMGKVSFQALGSGNSVYGPYNGWCVKL